MNLGDVVLPVGFGVVLTVMTTGVGWATAGSTMRANTAHSASSSAARRRSWFGQGNKRE